MSGKMWYFSRLEKTPPIDHRAFVLNTFIDHFKPTLLIMCLLVFHPAKYFIKKPMGFYGFNPEFIVIFVVIGIAPEGARQRSGPY